VVRESPILDQIFDGVRRTTVHVPFKDVFRELSQTLRLRLGR
jgi:hypothetical protein